MEGDQPLSEGMTSFRPAPGFAIWFTGLPAAGKTTLAQTVQRQLAACGLSTILLDSDELRAILTPEPTYSDGERDWFYSALAGLAALLTRNGVNVLIAATAHRRAYRDAARAQIERFAEVYVACPAEVCQQRDPKGIYARAEKGQAARVPGLGRTFEPPLRAELTIDTAQRKPAEAAALVIGQIGQLFPTSIAPGNTGALTPD